MVFEIVADVFTGILRLLFRIVSEVLLEFLLKGTGYLICRPFSKNIDPDGYKVVLVGLVFWTLVYIIAINVFNYVQVDKV
ncbi:hypothetical protein [Thalassotalea maritima]|uniref:hypothetical protein n=1 Tax=Thalassotalea maritima TaxID=3242416 RepID=UPI0035290655